MTNKSINVLQFICSTGFYGAERWILALAKHLDKKQVRCDLAITLEENSQDLELVKQYQEKCGETFEIPMAGRFDLSEINWSNLSKTEILILFILMAINQIF